MISLSTTRSKIAATAVLTAAAVSLAAAAFAAPSQARAPYAQAAALVNTDGTLLQNKGIKAVTNPSVGMYCITFTDSRVDPAKIVANATLMAAGHANGDAGGTPIGSTVMIRTLPSAECGDDPQAVTVYTAVPNGGLTNIPFYFAVS